MKHLGARWDITDQKDGQKKVVYANLCTGTIFDCGLAPANSPMILLLEFVIDEGDAGDMVFVNGQFYTQTHKEMCA